jgi:hypothetical protein
MKKLMIYGLILFASPVLMTSCGGGNSESSESEAAKTPKERIQGKWIIVEAEGEMAELNKGTVYSFNGDNYGMSKGIIDNKGKILEMTDNSYTAQFDGMETIYSFDYKFDGDKLVITPSGSGQNFVLEKQ